MKRLVLLFCLILTVSVKSQNLVVGFGYQYQKAFEWEKMINDYNYTSAWAEKNQPYLSGGLNANVNYVFDSRTILHSGPMMSYVFSRSYVNNTDSINSINQNMLNIGYLFQLSDEEKMKNFFFDFGIAFAMNFLNQKETYLDSSLVTKNKSESFGGTFDLKFGYKIAFGDNAWMSPYIGLGYSVLFPKNDQLVFLPSQAYEVQNLNYILSFKVGVHFEFRLPKKKRIED
jgi:hypothetical protein